MTVLQIRSDVRILAHGWTERVDGRPIHHSGLLRQLRDQVTDAGGIRDENRSGKAVGPKLPCDEDALSLLVEVEAEIVRLAAWVSVARGTQSAEANLQWLADHTGMFPMEAVEVVADGLAWLRDRIETFLQWLDGGTHTAWYCPRCEHRDLWLYTGDPGRELAVCRNCQERWHGEGGLRVLNSELR